MSEWMKIMLEEISRKKAESEQARIEEQRRRDAASGDTATSDTAIKDAKPDRAAGAMSGGDDRVKVSQ